MRNNLYIILFIMVLSTSAQAGGSPSGDQNVFRNDIGNKHRWLAPDEARERKNPIPKTFKSIERGKIHFLRNCVSCHGENAEGDGPVAEMLTPKPANLRLMAGAHSDGDFAWKIFKGRGPMPSWENILSENQVWDIVNYIQSLSGAGKVQHDDKH
jgi:mono/diheme cytochrome c family protein